MRVTPAWTLGILAGGRSRRLGHAKAEILYGSLTAVQHVARRLAPPGVPTLVVTRPDGPGRNLGLPYVEDVLPGEGPLSGMAALLSACETPYLLAVPCDQPLLPPDLGDRLLRHARGTEAVVLSVNDRVEPMPAFLSTELATLLHQLLSEGERRADAWLARAPGAVVPFAHLYPGLRPEDVLVNVNTPEDLARALDLLAADRTFDP